MKETVHRSIAKTISWRLTGSTSTFLITFLITGNIGAAGTIAIFQLVANTVLYFLHERIWNKIVWGMDK